MTKSFTELSAAETMELEGGRISAMLPAFGPLIGVYVPSLFIKPIIF